MFERENFKMYSFFFKIIFDSENELSMHLYVFNISCIDETTPVDEYTKKTFLFFFFKILFLRYPDSIYRVFHILSKIFFFYS